MKYPPNPIPAKFIRRTFVEVAKRLAFRYLRLGAPIYPYNVEPMQLAILVSEIERLHAVTGNIVEIGVARGMTTRFMLEYCLVSQLRDEKIFAIDTFTSFTKEDVDYEVQVRNKQRADFNVFGYNDYTVWKRNFSAFPQVTPIQADCSTFDYTQIAPIKLVFLDVDLFLPTKKALSLVYEHVVKSGVILVHDVEDNQVYDGAYQAFNEFCRERAIEPTIIDHKLGVIRK